MTKEANSRLELESGMRRGLERGEFVLQFQPLVSLVDGRIVGVEALTRWRSPSGLIPPDKFIPLAEETGLIVPLGDWVLREACGRMKAWRDAGAEIGVVAVNLSPIQLDRPDICDRIHAILEETGLPPHCLEIEITESALLEQQGDAEAKLAALKALGLRISIDDFGAGHSSLFYLKRFPIDKLKLDRSFIIDIPGDPTSMEIAAAIVHLAHSLKVDALAEGVETEAQAEFLKACGCKLAQGYLFDKPLWERELLAKYGVTREAVRILAG
jgi:EAL domain-containing protein (putative c-di-GMP-specific phosphodiesterase class I)